MVACGAEHTVIFCPNGAPPTDAEEGAGSSSAEPSECFSWGWGDFGRLGHGDYVDAFLPKSMDVLRSVPISVIACGDNHCHAVSNEGVVYSWGRNQNGQLGIGTREDSTRPVVVEALKGILIKMVACGAEHSVACTVDGSMYSWGWNCYGNLGLGDKVERLSPEKLEPIVAGTSGGGDVGTTADLVDVVACGWRHSAAITRSGRLFTFGWSRYGQLGHGDNEERLRPYELSCLGKIKVVQAGWRHTVAINTGGKLYAWGWNRFGQLGLGNMDDQNKPCAVQGDLADRLIANVCCGWRHTLALTVAGELYAFGRGVNGQLGNGTTEDARIPKPVVLGSDVNGAMGTKLQQEYVAASERYAVVPLAAHDKGGAPADAAVPCSGDDEVPLAVDDVDTGNEGPAPEQKRARVEAQ